MAELKIIDFPNEIIDMIIPYLNQIDIKNLRGSNTFFWENESIKILFKKIRNYNISYDRILESLESLELQQISLINTSFDPDKILTHKAEIFIPAINCWIQYQFQCDFKGFRPKYNPLYWIRARWMIDSEKVKKKYLTQLMIETLNAIPDQQTQFKYFWDAFVKQNISIREKIRNEYQDYLSLIERNEYAFSDLYYIFKNGDYHFGSTQRTLIFNTKF